MSAERRLASARAILSASALTGVTLAALAITSIARGIGGERSLAIALGALGAAGLLWWWRGVFSRRRVVLWLEERIPALRYALAALVDAPDTPVRPALEARVRAVRFGDVLGVAALRFVGIPLLALVASQFAVVPLVSRVAGRALTASSARDEASRASRPAGALRYAATVTPPAYSGQRAQTVENPLSIAALVGSSIRITGAFESRTTMPSLPAALRLERNGSSRVVALEPRPDSAPRVVLELPARDTVLATGRGVMRLVAVARDDIGITTGWFELIVSSGTGESFTFRSAVLGRTNAGNARDLRLGVTLPLDSLELKPGDVVHLRAVARDANTAADAEAGSSETRTLRVPRRASGH